MRYLFEIYRSRNFVSATDHATSSVDLKMSHEPVLPQHSDIDIIKVFRVADIFRVAKTERNIFGSNTVI